MLTKHLIYVSLQFYNSTNGKIETEENTSFLRDQLNGIQELVDEFDSHVSPIVTNELFASMSEAAKLSLIKIAGLKGLINLREIFASIRYQHGNIVQLKNKLDDYSEGSVSDVHNLKGHLIRFLDWYPTWSLSVHKHLYNSQLHLLFTALRNRNGTWACDPFKSSSEFGTVIRSRKAFLASVFTKAIVGATYKVC